jgi:NAD(P)-dependent dehydrogenase (short-subunit alcohol dehydrogenase family)
MNEMNAAGRYLSAAAGIVDKIAATQMEAIDIAAQICAATIIEDGLVCSAGIGGRSLGDGPTDQCTVEAWDQVLLVNLRGTFLTCLYAIPELIKTGAGSIVTISSELGLVGTQGLFDTHAYAASKAGIIGLTRAISAHYARDQLRANVIAPGLIDTEMAARAKANQALLGQVSH